MTVRRYQATGVEGESLEASGYEQQCKKASIPSVKQRVLTGGATLVVISGLCVSAVLFSEDIGRAEHYGYAGLFVISSFVGGTIGNI
jgi:hypothetical protein